MVGIIGPHCPRMCRCLQFGGCEGSGAGSYIFFGVSTGSRIPPTVVEGLTSVSPVILCDYYFVVFGAMSLHAALLNALSLRVTLLFSHAFWMTILLSFLGPNNIFHSILYVWLSSYFSQLVFVRGGFFFPTDDSTSSYPQCRLLLLRSCFQSSDF